MQVHIKRERNDDKYSACEGVSATPQNGHVTSQHVGGQQDGFPNNRPPPPLIEASQVAGLNNQYLQNGIIARQMSGNQDPQHAKLAEPVKQKVPETQIDYPSFKGMFGWTTIDGVNVPYIFRKDRKFMSVRVVEQKLLSRYPNSYPDELGKHQPLTSYFITTHEAKLLNEINIVHCGGEFGQKEFNTKDLIVLLEDFSEFHNLVKKTFPEHIVNAPPQHQINQAMVQESKTQGCGWIQVNNTVTPYINKNKDKYVPLSVMRYAASLNVPAQGILPEPEECNLLNKACKEVGFNFSFSKTTRVVSLTEVMKHFPITVIDLPSDNPLEYAQYVEVPAISQQPVQSMANMQQQQQQTDARPHLNHAYLQSAKELGQGQHMQTQIAPDRFPPPTRGPGPPGGLHPAFMDPRYMFSYNRFPYNVYNVPSGPPNVTVNPMSNGFGGSGQMPMPPPPYQHNHQMNGQVRPPQAVMGQQKGPSPSRSSGASITANGGPVQQRPPSTSRSSSSVWHDQTSKQQISPGRGKMPYSRSPNISHQQYQSQHQQMTPGKPMSAQSSANHARVGPPGAHMQSNLSRQSPHRVVGNPNLSQNGVVPPGQPIPPPPLMSGPHTGPMGSISRKSPQSCPPLTTSANNGLPNSRSRHSSGTSPVLDQQNGVKSPTSQVVSPVSGVQTGQGKTDEKSDRKSEVPSLTECIKGVWLGGKSISCMHLNGPKRTGKFCLVEAVCKLYFNGCSVNEFLFALENVLNVPLVTCTDEEEKAFIHYYSLPVTVLKCNKMIDFDDLEKFFPQLTYVFRGKIGSTEPHKTLSQNGSAQTQSPDKTNNGTSTATNHENQNGDQTFVQQRKRANSSMPPGQSKLPCRRLDEAVRKLHSQQKINDSGEGLEAGNGEKTGGSVIVLD
ncbi:uncharacterized protein LOC117334082 [Pecten maximus]|uniref:uncharacterized protein LOC117334082 n=1 Tax=Pecten maximus TaxID=6579 RepID=UPI0014581ADF|nr:uncharacterized protein LOC117334082 [Pecten maximus]XP_033749412.1 uncharacterized protein LOC117334082 [Pecten maximus]XP_033749413.1 uncharacterized protein LOC117334082 [Pecten maximus]XP_033749414.1 uncharacterized protein LOC117334082 [Pecten maximus]